MGEMAMDDSNIIPFRRGLTWIDDVAVTLAGQYIVSQSDGDYRLVFVSGDDGEEDVLADGISRQQAMELAQDHYEHGDLSIERALELIEHWDD